MSDHDRGAYTPQTEEPLTFDPRRPSERRPLPMTLIGSAVVLVLLIGGVALVYRGGVRHAGDAPRPVGQPVMSVKTAPLPSAQPANTASESEVYAENKPSAPPPAVSASASSQTGAQPGVSPKFTPSAEQPAPRPKPLPKTFAVAPPPQPAIKPVAPPPRTVASTSQTTVTSTQSSTDLDASEVAAAGMTSRAPDRPAPLKLAQATAKPRHVVATASTTETDDVATTVSTAKPATRPGNPGATGSAVVQIGAFSSGALADRGFADVSASMAGQMSGKSKHVTPIDKDGKTLYRTWVAGFGSRSEAVAFCEALRTRNKSCIVKS